MTSQEYEKFVSEFKPMHGHVCIMHDMEIVRLIGVAQSNIDWYYHVQYISPPTYMNGKKTGYSTAVGHLYSLKGLIPEERYQYMEKLFDWNCGEISDEFMEEDLGEERF